jgi:hypothetical protein
MLEATSQRGPAADAEHAAAMDPHNPD